MNIFGWFSQEFPLESYRYACLDKQTAHGGSDRTVAPEERAAEEPAVEEQAGNRGEQLRRSERNQRSQGVMMIMLRTGFD